MNSLPSKSRSSASPVPDTRMRDEADGYQGMHALVAELVLPTGRRASCFGRLRVMAGLVGARRLPAAT